MEYKFFMLNGAGLVDSADSLRLADDAAALLHARGLREPRRIEVWAGSRRVGVTPPARNVVPPAGAARLSDRGGRGA